MLNILSTNIKLLMLYIRLLHFNDFKLRHLISPLPKEKMVHSYATAIKYDVLDIRKVLSRRVKYLFESNYLCKHLKLINSHIISVFYHC